MRAYVEALSGQWKPRPVSDLNIAQFQIIEASGARAGCVETLDEPDHLLIRKLYVEPDFQNMGVGGAVLDQPGHPILPAARLLRGKRNGGAASDGEAGAVSPYYSEAKGCEALPAGPPNNLIRIIHIMELRMG